MSSPSPLSSRRITKTEKIAELQGKLKILTEESRRLKGKPKSKRSLLSTKLDGDSRHRRSSSDADTPSEGGGDNKSVGTNKSGGTSKSHTGERDKLKEALRALKRVTVKQEVSLETLRQRAKQRRSEIDQKGTIIKKLQQENKAFRIAHEKMKETNANDDVSVLRSQLAHLEFQLAKEECSKAEQSEKLKESEAGISNLQARLENVRGVRRTYSTGSRISVVSDASSSTSGEDITKLKKELAIKSEKISNLQYELEACKDEIHDLKQRDQFSNAFPATPTPGEDDFFDDDDNNNNTSDDDFFGTW